MVISEKRASMLAIVIILSIAFIIGSTANQAWAAMGNLQAASTSAQPSRTLKAQAAKIYPSEKSAKKAVIAKVRAKWKKTKPKVKIKLAGKKKKMTSDQKKALRAFKRSAGKNAKKYKFYVVTIRKPRFTVKAKYRDGAGNVKTYSLTAYSAGLTYSVSERVSGSGGFLEEFSGFPDTSKAHCFLFAVRKGSKYKWSGRLGEGNLMLTGVKVKSHSDFGPSEGRACVESAEINFKLKG